LITNGYRLFHRGKCRAQIVNAINKQPIAVAHRQIYSEESGCAAILARRYSVAGHLLYAVPLRSAGRVTFREPQLPLAFQASV
jgi:hypothetical protein